MDTRILAASDLARSSSVHSRRPAARADGEPVKLATTARFDMTADATVGALDDGQVVAGNGTSAG